MWDNAALLRNIAGTLTLFSVLAALYGIAHYLVHQPGLFPLQSVLLSASPKQVTAVEVLQIVRRETSGNIFTVNIDHLRQSLEKLPWVRSVNIRREFPDALLVDMEEHQVLAHWNKDALLNLQGEVFFVGADWVAKSGQDLPGLAGPEGSPAEVAQLYTLFSSMLSTQNLQVAQLSLSPRHAWQLRLNNGMVLELGREDMQQRLARFITARAQMDMSEMKYVDLRYRNGFAVKQVNSG